MEHAPLCSIKQSGYDLVAFIAANHCCLLALSHPCICLVDCVLVCLYCRFPWIWYRRATAWELRPKCHLSLFMCINLCTDVWPSFLACWLAWYLTDSQLLLVNLSREADGSWILVLANLVMGRTSGVQWFPSCVYHFILDVMCLQIKAVSLDVMCLDSCIALPNCSHELETDWCLYNPTSFVWRIDGRVTDLSVLLVPGLEAWIMCSLVSGGWSLDPSTKVRPLLVIAGLHICIELSYFW